jgi:hypothetical protein
MAATKSINRISQNGSTVKGKSKAEKTEASKKKQISIQPLDLQIAKLKIVGLTDLICKQMSQKTQDKLVAKGSKSTPQPKAAIDPYQEACDSLYLMPGSSPAFTKGAKYGFPLTGVKASVVTAAGRFLKDGLTLTGKVVEGSLFIIPPVAGCNLIPIIHPASDPYQRSDQGRNPSSGGAIVIHRGAFAKWSMEFMIRYNAAVLSLEQIATLFMWGGFAVGIGEWRPENSGSNGQYEVNTK